MRVGAGGYATEWNEGNVRDPAPPEFRTARVRVPVPSNAWWSSLVWERYSGVMVAGPLSMVARADGLALGYPPVAADPDGFGATFVADLAVGLSRVEFPDARLEGYGDWTVDALWAKGGQTLRATFGHGLPYAWFRLTGGPARVTFGEAPEVWFNDGATLGLAVEGRAYGVFAPPGTSWRGTGSERTTREPLPYLVVAALPDGTLVAPPARQLEVLRLFQAHAPARPVGSRATWRWDRAAGRVETTLTLETKALDGSNASPLQALYPHQWRRSGTPTLNLGYRTGRRVMRLLPGRRFTTSTPYGGVLATLPAPPAAARPEIRRHLLEYVANASFFPLAPESIRITDGYTDGRNLGRLNQLLLIAEQLGEAEAAKTLLAAMRSRLEEWLEPAGPHAVYLFPGWNSAIPAPSSHGSDWQLNDHHFDWGYFLQAAATVTERDPDWGRRERWGGMVNLLARDVAAGRGDPMFPFMRHFDPYAGHSWASGDNRGRLRGANQESSSEAVNFAADLVRWAEATGDAATLERAVWLYALETDAVWQYWLAAGHNFPAGFEELGVGIVWGDGGQYGTWWTPNREAIAGINVLPLTGASLYLGRDPGFVLRHFASFTPAVGPRYWPDVTLGYLALADPERARKLWNPETRPDFGESRTHTLHWLEGLRALGRPDPSVTADAAQYAVFVKDGRRTHVAHNPSGEPRRVTFSDGTVLTVPPRATATDRP